ncbi:MAG: hypothetical protein AB1634_09815 [Thermodesulfobacteriota bacterium]
MDGIDRVQLLAELGDSFCDLNHGPGTQSRDYPAADYIVLPFGYQDGDHVAVAVREIVIPVCTECAQALLGEEWTLLYCFECGASRWVCRALARNRYRHHILWLRGCPDCTSQFGGLYFSDLPLVGRTELVNQHLLLHAA